MCMDNSASVSKALYKSVIIIIIIIIMEVLYFSRTLLCYPTMAARLSSVCRLSVVRLSPETLLHRM